MMGLKYLRSEIYAKGRSEALNDLNKYDFI